MFAFVSHHFQSLYSSVSIPPRKPSTAVEEEHIVQLFNYRLSFHH